jgi:phosphate/sulfate permease
MHVPNPSILQSLHLLLTDACSGHIFNSQLEPDEVMDLVLSIVLITVVCLFIAYFIVQVIQNAIKLCKETKKKQEKQVRVWLSFRFG